jgi:hypothetical protein
MNMDDDIEFLEAPDGQVFMLQDRATARTLAYISLMELTARVKDDDVKAEGLEMLKRLRLSVSVHSEVHLGVVKGGKPN